MEKDSSKIILGIDPGSRITGYGVIEYKNHAMTPIDFGTIRPPASLSLEKRYLIIFNGIEELIQKFHPHSIAVENQFVQKNAQSSLKLGMAKGAVLIAAAKNNIELFNYAPKQAKLAVVGNGMASKQQVQKMVQIILHLNQLPTPEDASDALSLAICHAHHSQKIHLLNTRI
jgi:crossover junction endodeoxyribonuclease RuvC